jgi:hypothetical protein
MVYAQMPPRSMRSQPRRDQNSADLNLREEWEDHVQLQALLNVHEA